MVLPANKPKAVYEKHADDELLLLVCDGDEEAGAKQELGHAEPRIGNEHCCSNG